ncbi:MAG TPA: SIMPL domain-containing protein [Polyangium sp.]|nr:SIMPL domain-containing protein [Polyangium sp.]
MKKLSSLLFALIFPASIVLTGCGAGHHSSCAMPASQQAIRSVTVVGHGESMGKPDVARTSLGVEATAPTVQDAMDQTTAKMNAILDALKKMGIAEKDIKTANFSISIERPYPEPGPMPSPAMEPMAAPVAPVKPGGKAAATAPAAPSLPPRPMPAILYHVNNTVEVIVRDVSKASRVVQAAVDAGANNVWNVSFAIDDTKALEADARTKAIADARTRAEALAKLEGLTLGDVLRVSEVIGQGPIGPMATFGGMAEAKFAGGPALAPGEVTMGTSIEVVFALGK